MKTEPIRIESDRVQKVREHVANTKQTISGFIALAIDAKLKKEDDNYISSNPGDDTIAKKSAKALAAMW